MVARGQPTTALHRCVLPNTINPDARYFHMTRSHTGSLILTAVLCAVAGSAYAQQPPDVVQSDGMANTAMGQSALQLNEGSNGAIANTAAGYEALQANTTGGRNSAFGESTLYANTTGINNTGCGAEALFRNETGAYNSASGAQALFENITGSGNTAVGIAALYSNKIGGNNIALGAYAGYYISGGYRNIDIGNVGVQPDSGTIRLGTSGQHFATYIAGISNVHLTGSAVYISSSGQLGVLASSERYKTAIEPMAQRTEKLKQLRPVAFHLKTDPKGDVQYGLIAEEVAKVYPELVIRDEKGQIEGVRYEELAPMLLNELQAMQLQIAELKRSMQGRAAER
jgi:hypothetical protein